MAGGWGWDWDWWLGLVAGGRWLVAGAGTGGWWLVACVRKKQAPGWNSHFPYQSPAMGLQIGRTPQQTCGECSC